MENSDSQLLQVRVSEKLLEALDYSVKFEIIQRPLLPTSRSAIVRELIADHYNKIKRLECPQCGQMTIPDEHRPGARWCGNCAEPVLWVGDKDNGA